MASRAASAALHVDIADRGIVLGVSAYINEARESGFNTWWSPRAGVSLRCWAECRNVASQRKRRQKSTAEEKTMAYY